MEVIKKKYGFKFIVPDEFEEIPEDEYERYNFDLKSTIAVFVKLEKGIPTSFSINRDDEVHNEDEYLELIDTNIRNMEGMEMIVTEHIHHTNKRGRIDTLYSDFKGLKYAIYFTVVHNIMIACGTEIKEINDENDKVLSALFESIEEF